MTGHLISIMIFAPLLGTVAELFFGRVVKFIALLAGLSSGVIGIGLVLSLSAHPTPIIESFEWVSRFSFRYEVMVDGLNSLLVLLISLVFSILLIADWQKNSAKGASGNRALLLMIQTSLLGVVCASDLFLIFFFWAASMLPFYFHLSFYGEKERETSSLRYFIIASISNGAFLCLLLLVFFAIKPPVFSLKELGLGRLAEARLPFLDRTLSVSHLGFIFLILTTFFRLPIWPLHGWFSLLLRKSSATAAVVLTGAMVPVSIYLFIRLGFTLFPKEMAGFSEILLISGFVNILAGSICSLSQRNLKSLISYVCIAEVGTLLVGISAYDTQSLSGVVFQLLAIGLGLAGFGLFIDVVYERTGETDILQKDQGKLLGSLGMSAPMLMIFVAIMCASLLGIPIFAGFIGDALILMGSFSKFPGIVLGQILSWLLLTGGVVLAFRSVFMGKPGKVSDKVSDLSLYEKGYLFPIAVVIVLMGVYPKPFLDLVSETVNLLITVAKT